MWYRILGMAFVAALLLMAPSGAKAQPAFEDVAPQLGLVDDDGCGTPFWYDFDGDGDLDLLRNSRYNTDSHIYRNDGDHFTRMDGIGMPTGVDGGCSIPMDFDHDGDLDIAVGGYFTAHQLLINDGTNHFVDRWTGYGLPLMNGSRLLDWIDFNRDGWMDLLLQTSSGWHLYRNVNGDHFVDATTSVNLPDDDGAGFCIADVDLDGQLDMFATRIGSTGRYWHNAGNGVFVDMTLAAGLAGIPASFCCAWVDFNNDKYPDLLTQDYEQHGIWLNNGDGTFRAAQVHGTECDFSQWPYGAWYSIADFDMDGHPDFYCNRPGGCSDNLAPNQFMHMDSIVGDDLWFHDIAPGLGLDYQEDGTANWADYDNDGDLDLSIVSATSPRIRLLRNNTLSRSNLLQVRVLGPNGEQDQWHARVEVYPHGSTNGIRLSELNYSNVSCNGLSSYFVIDQNAAYDLRIYFPDGTVMLPTTYAQLSGVVPAEINHRMTVRLGQTSDSPNHPPALSEFRLDTPYPNPFNSATTLRYSVPTAGQVRLAVYNVVGQHVTDLVNTRVTAGEHRQTWDASALSSGIYFVELRTATTRATQKIVLMK